jgi:hypothetical protein
MNIETLATKVAENLENKNAAIDPATITAIIALITQVINAIKACKTKPAAAAEMVKSPGIFARIMLRSIVRDNMSRADFRDHGESIIKALQKTGTTLTEDDIKALLV